MTSDVAEEGRTSWSKTRSSARDHLINIHPAASGYKGTVLDVLLSRRVRDLISATLPPGPRPAVGAIPGTQGARCRPRSAVLGERFLGSRPQGGHAQGDVSTCCDALGVLRILRSLVGAGLPLADVPAVPLETPQCASRSSASWAPPLERSSAASFWGEGRARVGPVAHRDHGPGALAATPRRGARPPRGGQLRPRGFYLGVQVRRFSAAGRGAPGGMGAAAARAMASRLLRANVSGWCAAPRGPTRRRSACFSRVLRVNKLGHLISVCTAQRLSRKRWIKKTSPHGMVEARIDVSTLNSYKGNMGAVGFEVDATRVHQEEYSTLAASGSNAERTPASGALGVVGRSSVETDGTNSHGDVSRITSCRCTDSEINDHTTTHIAEPASCRSGHIGKGTGVGASQHRCPARC